MEGRGMTGARVEPRPAIEQAKTETQPAAILPIAAKPGRSKAAAKLTRVDFRVSRLMEFCTRRELQNQTGHSVEEWPLVVLKELIDKSLDACEEAEIAPVILIAVAPASITIHDNGAGIAPETIGSILDYTIRVSSREAYVSPTRGAQGNALKTILAMGYVLDRARHRGSNVEAAGVTVIESRGLAHRIEFRVDHINNEPRITHTTSPAATTGTRITIEWPDAALLNYARGEFIALAQSYVWFNPHLTLRGTWNGEEFVNVMATNPAWGKWGPRDPTSPHWYDEPRLQRYLAAHVARDRDAGVDRPLRDFIGEFRGLSGTTKRKTVLREVGCSHVSLAEFFGRDRVNSEGIAKLLASMKGHSKPVAPKLLGIIGADHLKARFLAAGGHPETFAYQQRKGITTEGVPYVVETVFGLHQSALNQSAAKVRRKFIVGANWSVGIKNPFRSFGSTGEGLENKLADLRIDASQPVICGMHLACARLEYADRGKSSIILNSNARQPND
jgi:DNA topoisomerase VI subunit B